MFRYITKEEFRVLTAVEMGMRLMPAIALRVLAVSSFARNHEHVPTPLVESIAKISIFLSINATSLANRCRRFERCKSRSEQLLQDSAKPPPQQVPSPDLDPLLAMRKRNPRVKCSPGWWATTALD